MDGVDESARESVKDLRTELKDIRESKVRKDVYEAEQKGIVLRIAEVEKDVVALEARTDKESERRAADRRLIMTSLVLPILVALILIYVQTQIGG